jgi:hypothetical protein
MNFIRKDIFERRSRIIFFCLFLSLAANICSGEESNPSYMKVSALLYPETKSWTPVNKMKVPTEAYLRKYETQFRKAYNKSKISKEEWESKGCSFINRIFSEEFHFPKNFYIQDLDSDGYMDVIYTGSNQCAEGNSTVIWFGARNGFVIKQDILWQVLTIRIKEGSPVRLSSVEVGCCGSVKDEYYIGTLLNIRNQGIRSITRTTYLPTPDEKIVPFIAKDGELVLRSTPAVNDLYDENESGFVDAAVFGNVLTKLLPGCSGNIVGRYIDKESKPWLFVILDEKCNVLRTHVPYSVSAGWIDALSIK